MDALHKKFEELKNYLRGLGSVAVAFSAGVDSTFLLKVAHDVLGSKAVAITIKSRVVPGHEMQEAIDFCKSENIRHEILSFDEMAVEGFKENPANRCYVCKHAIFSEIIRRALELECNAVCEGSNVDDLGDYRPGLKAIAELGIKSPLREAVLTKADIRALSLELKLLTANKPSFACLASRIPYGEQITEEKLKLVECAEQYLQNLGFVQYRVRCRLLPQSGFGTAAYLAGIEVLQEQFPLFYQKQAEIGAYLTSIGFFKVELDERGYRTGSLNETIVKRVHG